MAVHTKTRRDPSSRIKVTVIYPGAHSQEPIQLLADFPKKPGSGFVATSPVFSITATADEPLQELIARFEQEMAVELTKRTHELDPHPAAVLALTLLEENAPWLFGPEPPLPYDDPFEEVNSRVTEGSVWRANRPPRPRPAAPDPDPATKQRIGTARPSSRHTFGRSLYTD